MAQFICFVLGYAGDMLEVDNRLWTSYLVSEVGL
jgi:hypothetical protein